MASIKTIIDPIKGSYDILVTDGNQSTGAVLPGDASIVAGLVSASLGSTTFIVSGSGMALTATLPAIDASILGKSARVLADSAAIAVSGVNGLASPANAWTAPVAAYGVVSYVAVSGSSGYYWHNVI